MTDEHTQTDSATASPDVTPRPATEARSRGRAAVRRLSPSPTCWRRSPTSPRESRASEPKQASEGQNDGGRRVTE
jgi:hypothetical protein